ncbi:hypothetical protein [Alkalihalobacterium chitinilyticum]|uniref:Plasmid segregation centromere-binding protein ParR n=1 Tax=Alkalihalobacterium chitinilyticum TaxID=2980103 RepID=A0ABT5VGK9_9BACI|nr:hypothetical protein [Alkalihalobacterium chitinilyticum]MDE5414592.1 hypothetical protein [Alkalihalobacterium chitinilyticum]
MKKKGTTEIQRGQAITFRLPSDTPDHIIKQLQKLKETERRNFSSKIAQFALEGVNQSLVKERETLTIPLPKPLSKEQRNWLKHSHSEALLGTIVYQLLSDPVRATSILAALNSNSLDIDEALYLQEVESEEPEVEQKVTASMESPLEDQNLEDIEEEVEESKDIDFDDDLENFNWNEAKQEIVASAEEPEEKEEDIEDLLGGFLAQMNK